MAHTTRQAATHARADVKPTVQRANGGGGRINSSCNNDDLAGDASSLVVVKDHDDPSNSTQSSREDGKSGSSYGDHHVSEFFRGIKRGRGAEGSSSSDCPEAHSYVGSRCGLDPDCPD